MGEGWILSLVHEEERGGRREEGVIMERQRWCRVEETVRGAVTEVERRPWWNKWWRLWGFSEADREEKKRSYLVFGE